MSTFDVTTAITAYETYVVEADSAEEAIRLVRDEEQRSRLPSRPAGHNDDETVIDVKGAGVSPGLRSSLTFRPGPNVENIRSSTQSKRDVTPVPKKGKRGR